MSTPLLDGLRGKLDMAIANAAKQTAAKRSFTTI